MVTFILILLGLILFLIVGGFVGFLVSRRWLPQLDNINKAIVFIKNGKSYTTKKGTCLNTNKKGKSYEYDGHVAILKIETEDEYIKHRRIIVVGAKGNIIGTTISDVGRLLTQDENSSIIESLTLGHIGTEMLKAMSGKLKGGGAIILFLIIGIIVGSLLGFGIPKLLQKQPGPQNQGVITNTITTTHTPVLTPTPTK